MSKLLTFAVTFRKVMSFRRIYMNFMENIVRKCIPKASLNLKCSSLLALFGNHYRYFYNKARLNLYRDCVVFIWRRLIGRLTSD